MRLRIEYGLGLTIGVRDYRLVIEIGLQLAFV